MQAIASLNYQESFLSAGLEDENVLRDTQKEASQGSEKVSQDLDGDTSNDDDVAYVKGEPVITSGSDVSRFLVDVRDDGDPALTFRSLCIGTVFACLGAALCQVRLLFPISACLIIRDRSTYSNQFKLLCRPCFSCCSFIVWEWLGPRFSRGANSSRGLGLAILVLFSNS